MPPQMRSGSERRSAGGERAALPHSVLNLMGDDLSADRAPSAYAERVAAHSYAVPVGVLLAKKTEAFQVSVRRGHLLVMCQIRFPYSVAFDCCSREKTGVFEKLMYMPIEQSVHVAPAIIVSQSPGASL